MCNARPCCLPPTCVRSGNRLRVEADQSVSTEKLVSERRSGNEALLGSLREDSRSSELVQMCLDDAKRGRMRTPVLARDIDLGAVTLSPRFCIEQGTAPVAIGALFCRPYSLPFFQVSKLTAVLN